MKIAPKKNLGQNFLIDENVIDQIIDIANISREDSVLEVGPGTGNLTSHILKNNPKKIFVIEKDNNLASFLADQFKNNAPSSPEHAAKVIIKNIKKKNKRILIGADAHFYDLMSRLFPKHFLKIIWVWPFLRSLFTRNK